MRPVSSTFVSRALYEIFQNGWAWSCMLVSNSFSDGGWQRRIFLRLFANFTEKIDLVPCKDELAVWSRLFCATNNKETKFRGGFRAFTFFCRLTVRRIVMKCNCMVSSSLAPFEPSWPLRLRSFCVKYSFNGIAKRSPPGIKSPFCDVNGKKSNEGTDPI